MKNKRISILSALAITGYCLMVAFSFIDDWSDFKRGFIQGYNTVDDHSIQDYTSSELFFLSLETKNHILTFPDTINNLKDKKNYPVIISGAKVEYPKSMIPQKVKVFNGIGLFLTFLLLICYIAIPILFISIMRSIAKENIFLHQNIKSINLLGIFLISIFCLSFSLEIISHLSNTAVFDFSDYLIKIKYPDFIWGLMGIIALLLSEILKRAVFMKEEQDLTI